MSDDSTISPLDPLAEEFAERYRRGERPSISEYVQRYPEFADEIRELFPALVLMEKARTGNGSSPVPEGKTAAAEISGDQIGDFRIIREVGRGGMGIVYEAIQEPLGRHVALKILPAGVRKNSVHIQRFQREARAAARLHHTNIVPVFAVGESDGHYYYAMQFIQGRGLDEVAAEVRRIREKRAHPEVTHSPTHHEAAEPLAESLMSGDFRSAEFHQRVSGEAEELSKGFSDDTQIGGSRVDQNESEIILPGQSPTTSSCGSGRAYWESVARIGVQVAEALQYASDEGVLHRDIKPSNLMLDLKGTVWVTDFGLAKADDSDALTQTGDILGTLRYMAPERFQGHSDIRSDIYGLGATLYELVALRPLYSETARHQLIRQITEPDSEPVRKPGNGVPADLETVILKSISKEPSDRYATAAQLAEDLRRFLEDRPILARRISRREQLWKWCRRNRAMASLLTMLGVLTCLLLVGMIIARAIGRDRDVAVANLERAEIAEAESTRLLRRADTAERESRIRAHLAQANIFRLSGNEGQRFQCLDELRQAVKLSPEGSLKDDLRDSAIAALGLTDIRPILRQQADVLGSSCFDHSLRRFAIVNLHGNRDAAAPESNSQIAGHGDFSLSVWTVEDNKEIFRRPGPDLDTWHAELVFSPEDRFLLVHYCIRGREDRLDVWDLQSGELNLSTQILSSDITIAVAISPDGRVLSFPFNNREVIVWDLLEKREMRRIALRQMTTDLCFDPTATQLVVNEFESRDIALLDTATGQEVDRLTDPGPETGAPGIMAWSSDGKLLAVCRDDSTVCIWNTQKREITSLLKGHSNLITRCEFVNNGYLLLTYGWDKTSKLWNASTGECLLTSERPLSMFSKDGKHIAYSHLSSLEYGVCEISHEAQVRTLHDPGVGNETVQSELPGISWAEFDGEKRLLAVFGNKGVALWDVDTCRQHQRLDMGHCYGVLYHSDGSDLITSTDFGAFRWPISSEETDKSVRLHYGPPEKIAAELQMDTRDICWLPGCQAMAIYDRRNRQVVILSAQSKYAASDAVFLPSRYRDVSNLAVSPDGHWLAGSGHHIKGIQIWNLKTKERIEISDGDGQADVGFFVSFSPDGRWLISSESAESAATGHYFFETGTWKRQRFQKTLAGPGAPVFSRDSRLFAAIAASHEVLIADLATGRTITQFRVSDERLNQPLALLGQQAVLAVAGEHDVFLWNLASISDSLQELGLPWDQSLQAVAEPNVPKKSLELTVDQGTLPAEARSRQAFQLAIAGRYDQSSAVYSEAIALAPDVALTLNNFAWMLVTRSDHNAEHAKRAVELAQRAVSLEPGQAFYWNTLGVAQYRNGEFRPSIESLEKAESLQPRQWFSFNAYFIAMAYWQLGEHDKATHWYADAVKDHEAKGLADEELQAFRREAEALMQVPR